MSEHHGAPRVSGTISVGGDLSGAAAVGSDIRQHVRTTHSAPPSDAELDELRSLVEQLRTAILEQAQPDLQHAAAERADELADAVLQQPPDLCTLEHLRNWFGTRIPKVASAVTTLVFHPVLGKLVAAGGDGLVAEFRRRFGA